MRWPRFFRVLFLYVSWFPVLGHAVAPPPDVGQTFEVVTAQHCATDVGYEVLRNGGNAIDAAVAIGYALAVVFPAAGNLGGGGFMTIHLATGKETFINFREKAPLRAKRDMYLDANGGVVPGLSTEGYLAVGVPGSPAGLDYALRKYGTISRAQAILPAIGLAVQGFRLEPGDVEMLGEFTEEFRKQPNIARTFLKAGRPYEVGDRLVQPELARTLFDLSQDGPEAFYGGTVAQAIVAASDANGGILSLEDFQRYRVEEMAPVRTRYRGFEVVSSPPPSSGGTIICEILNILSGYPLADDGFHSAKAVHFCVEAMRHAYVDRTRLGDPNFIKNPVEELLSEEHAAAIRGRIDPVKATPSSELRPETSAAHEGGQTTHYSVVDRWGNAVAVTYTINSYFGAMRIAGDTGMFLNNEMDDFTAKPGVPNQFGLIQGDGNAIEPEKRPLSSMSPTVVLKDGKPFLVTGSPGGSRIITITLETLLNVIDYGMTVQEAVSAPRFHHQWLPDMVYLEPYALSADTQALLEGAGYHFILEGPWEELWGSAQSIEVPYEDLTTGPVVAPGQTLVGKTLKEGLRYGGLDYRSPAASARGDARGGAARMMNDK